MLLYYISARTQFECDAAQQCARVLDKIAEAARAGVDYIQLRERDLTTRELERLAREAVARVRESGTKTKLLINSRIDVAIATGADGVHLRSDDLAASEARAIWAKLAKAEPLIGVSCHRIDEIRSAESHGANFVVYGPVFGKQGSKQPPAGLDALSLACMRCSVPDKKVEAGHFSGMPVLALGGVTLENFRNCMEAGASGLAAIRLFQENDVTAIIQMLK